MKINILESIIIGELMSLIDRDFFFISIYDFNYLAISHHRTLSDYSVTISSNQNYNFDFAYNCLDLNKFLSSDSVMAVDYSSDNRSTLSLRDTNGLGSIE